MTLRKDGPRCPICGKPQDKAFRPFCSRRCADVDLSRWLNGSYAIPSDEPVDPDADLSQEETRRD
ncbi:MAG: DNA gyrase inhibitor YacG [Pseudomonadota bacterium]